MWYGDYHFNINVQMNYWPTMASNLGECLIPYNDYLKVLAQDVELLLLRLASRVNQEKKMAGLWVVSAPLICLQAWDRKTMLQAGIRLAPRGRCLIPMSIICIQEISLICRNFILL